MDAIAKAPHDGYTIGYGSVGPLAISRHLTSKLPYDPEKDFQAISQVGMSQVHRRGKPVEPDPSPCASSSTAPGRKPTGFSYGASNGSIQPSGRGADSRS
jgi:hypothetical protein